MRTLTVTVLALFFAPVAQAQEAPKTRLFILSGQSNMAGLKPERTFTPAIQAAFPKDENIVVKSAQGGQPIRQWVKNWKPPQDSKFDTPKFDIASNGKLYDVLMTEVNKKIAGKKIDTVAFIWMQGERDAREHLESVYEESLRNLVGQVKADLKHPEIAVVIGRLSDCAKDASWNAVRAAQVSFAEKNPLSAWVDTDDLNGDKNSLHYTQPGYDELGRRFATKAVELLRKVEK